MVGVIEHPKSIIRKSRNISFIQKCAVDFPPDYVSIDNGFPHVEYTAEQFYFLYQDKKDGWDAFHVE